MANSSTVVLVSGIQGTGKTTLARAIAAHLGICVFSRDPFMQRLMDDGFPLSGLPDQGVASVPALGYAIQTVILEQQLMLGSSVVLECIMSPDIQLTWTSICQEQNATLLTVESTCSDRTLHRERVERRHRAGASRITWEIAGQWPASYRTNPSADYVADAVEPVETHVNNIADLLKERRPRPRD